MAAELTDELGSDPAADAYVTAYLADGQMAQLANNHPSRIVRALARALVAATQGAEPVAEVYRLHYGGRMRNIGTDAIRQLVPSDKLPPPGTKLYAASPTPPTKDT